MRQFYHLSKLSNTTILKKPLQNLFMKSQKFKFYKEIIMQLFIPYQDLSS